jgi:Domain of unknown function (DUF4937
MRRVARPQNMLLKRIVCDVPEDLRAGFSTAQEVWQTTAGAAGFQGQIGGFVDGTAQILALWSSRKQYQRFMSDTHDAVASSARQRDWYTSIAIDLYDFIFQMPGSNSDMASALSHATFARIAEYEVHPNREAHFSGLRNQSGAPAWLKPRTCSAERSGVRQNKLIATS